MPMIPRPMGHKYSDHTNIATMGTIYEKMATMYGRDNYPHFVNLDYYIPTTYMSSNYPYNQVPRYSYQPYLYTQTTQPQRSYSSMSGFLSSEAERALMGDESNAQSLFHEGVGGSSLFGMEDQTPYVDDNSRWAHAHTSSTGLDFFHPAPSQTAAYGQAGPSSGGSLDPMYAPSRSPSPHPADLNNYGFLNPDNRTWRCAYPGCASKALFARPCDLRKHFNRHSKDYHCRHDGCPQATEGGFSSKKDRARHEAKHNPGVECEWEGCERIFSRVDNMKDHVRRIHRRGS